MKFPQTQRDLLLVARGRRSQADFATLIGVARSSLSRYENEKLGLPIAALNACLREVAKLQQEASGDAGDLFAGMVEKAASLLADLEKLS